MRYKRVLLKMSGEAMLGLDEKNPKFPYDPDVFEMIALEIVEARKKGVNEIAIVPGGGNIARGEAMCNEQGVDRVDADQYGMLATVQNGIILRSRLKSFGIDVRLTSAIPMPKICEDYIVHKARHHLEHGRVVILAGGTGDPYCSTDTAAAQRASELKADVICMAKNVDGVYDKDPKKHDDAKFLTQVSFERALLEDLKVMDRKALDHCRTQNLPIVVFGLKEKGNIASAMCGVPIGTLVSNLPDPA